MQGERFVTIAICTYERSDGLERLLRTLNIQKGIPGDYAIELLIVDNSLSGSAKLVFDKFKTRLPFKSCYVHEPKRGLVIARNRAIEIAWARKRNALIFIDDDEWPTEFWLSSFLSAHTRHPEAVLAGPVIPAPEQAFPKWDPDGQFWNRATHADLEPLGTPVGDGNILYPRRLMEEGLRYDSHFNTSGAQDTDILLHWLKTNRPIIWVLGAQVFENLPSSRLKISWIIRRKYFSSLTYVWVEKKHDLNLFRWLARIAKHLAMGLIFLLSNFLMPTRALALFASEIALSVGTFVGLFKNSYDRYL